MSFGSRPFAGTILRATGMPTPLDVARSQGYHAFRTERLCPYDHFIERELVEAFYFGMAQAELDLAASEKVS